MSDELKPCPFCGCEMSIYTPNRDWHYLRGDHDENCIFSQSLMHPMVPCNENHRIMLVKDWNRRPTPEQSREARDGERLDWLVAHEAWIAWSNDGEVCRVFHRDEEGDPEPFEGWIGSTNYDTAREAIDAAMGGAS